LSLCFPANSSGTRVNLLNLHGRNGSWDTIYGWNIKR